MDAASPENIASQASPAPLDCIGSESLRGDSGRIKVDTRKPEDKSTPLQRAVDAWKFTADSATLENSTSPAPVACLNTASLRGNSGRVRIDTTIVTNSELQKVSAREEAALRHINATPATERKIQCFKKSSEQAAPGPAAPAADYFILHLAAVNALVNVVACKTCRGCV